MADIEKEPVRASEPAVEVGVATDVPKTQKFLSFLTEQKNDPNVLGKELLQKALEYDPEQLERDGIKVRRKLDFIVIPMVCMCFALHGILPDTDGGLCIDDDHLHVELLG